MALTFEFVSETRNCDHLNKSYRAILSCVAVYSALQCGSNHQCDHSNESYRANNGAVYYAVQGGSNV